LTEWPEGHPDDRPPPVDVPPDELSPDALRGVAEAFVLREGTDYGASEVSHDAKVAQVIRQLERGEARIQWDPVTESINVVPSVPVSRAR
jgi:uncharacterized protein